MSKEKGIGKPREKRLRNTTLKEELWTPDYITQATPRTILIFYILNFSSKPPMIITSFLKSGQFFLQRSTNSSFGLVGPEHNPALGSKPKLVLTVVNLYIIFNNTRLVTLIFISS